MIGLLALLVVIGMTLTGLVVSGLIEAEKAHEAELDRIRKEGR